MNENDSLPSILTLFFNRSIKMVYSRKKKISVRERTRFQGLKN